MLRYAANIFNEAPTTPGLNEHILLDSLVKSLETTAGNGQLVNIGHNHDIFYKTFLTLTKHSILNLMIVLSGVEFYCEIWDPFLSTRWKRVHRQPVSGAHDCTEWCPKNRWGFSAFSLHTSTSSLELVGILSQSGGMPAPWKPRTNHVNNSPCYDSPTYSYQSYCMLGLDYEWNLPFTENFPMEFKYFSYFKYFVEFIDLKKTNKEIHEKIWNFAQIKRFFFFTIESLLNDNYSSSMLDVPFVRIKCYEVNLYYVGVRYSHAMPKNKSDSSLC